jgi:transcriptional regulator with XRE-family HTH domain
MPGGSRARQPKKEGFAKMGTQKWTDGAFGKRIKAERERQGWSQVHMANMLSRRKTDMHATTIAKIEAGTRSVRINEAVAIADLFEVGLDYLLGRHKPDSSTLEFALTLLSDCATDTSALIGKAEGAVTDLEDQLESIEARFDFPQSSELHGDVQEIKRQLAAAQASARKLGVAALDAIAEPKPQRRAKPTR